MSEKGWGRLFLIALALLPFAVSAPSDLTVTGSLHLGAAPSSETAELFINGSALQVPTAPSLVGTYSETGQFDEPWEVVVQGTYAFVASAGDDAIFSFDISDPTNPRKLQELTDATLLNAVQAIDVSGNYLYAGSVDNGPDYFVVIDIREPDNMTIVGNDTGNWEGTDYLWGVNDVHASGDYVYVLETTDNLLIYDVSEPTAPKVIGNYDDTANAELDWPWQVYVQNGIAYVAVSGNDSLTLLNVSNPANITLLDSHTSSDLDIARDVKVRGRYAYVVARSNDYLSTFDVSDPSSIQYVDKYQDTTYLNGASAIEIVGDYAYITNEVGSYFTVVDISDPDNPVSTGLALSLGTSSGGFDIGGGYAYIADRDNDQFQVVDLHAFRSHGATFGGLEATRISVEKEAEVSAGLQVHGGVRVGARGLFTQGPVSVGSASAVPVPNIYLTGTAVDGDHNCDDQPENCCYAGYHMCTVPEFLEGGRRVVWGGVSGRQIETYGDVDPGDDTLGLDCTGWSSNSGSGTRFSCRYISTGPECTTLSSQCDDTTNGLVWCCID